MNKTAEVVIIGAGIQGLSAAYHLVKLGLKDVVVVEKEFVGAGASGNSAAMVMKQRENQLKIELSIFSYNRYMDFKEELGVDPNFKQIGFLSAVTEPMKELALTRARLRQSMGVTTEILEPSDIKKLVPVVNVEDLVLGVFGHEDGVVDVPAVMGGFAEQVRQKGGLILQGTRAIGIKTSNNRVVEVSTTDGPISTSIVVNAAGGEATEVGKWIGIELPIRNSRRHIFVTKEFPQIPDNTPMVEDAEVEWYYRKEGPGVLMGMGKELSATSEISVDWTFLPKMIEFAMHRVPVFEQAQMLRGWSGIRPMTPDLSPIVGPIESVQGYLNLCGWGGEGVQHAPSGGQMIAEVVVYGAAKTHSIEPFLFSRFKKDKE